MDNLTGRVRLRKGLFGNLVPQVEYTHISGSRWLEGERVNSWRDATVNDLVGMALLFDSLVPGDGYEPVRLTLPEVPPAAPPPPPTWKSTTYYGPAEPRKGKKKAQGEGGGYLPTDDRRRAADNPNPKPPKER